MKKETINYICCPKCLGDLEVNNEIFDTVFSEKEIYEGSLLCASCSSCYPIIFGIAFLVKDHYSYLSKNKNSLIKILLERESSERVFNYIKGLPDHIYGSPKVESWDSPMGTEVYAYNQYFPNEIIVNGSKINSFYEVIPEAIINNFTKENLNIELGCNTGGILYKSSSDFLYNIGVDLSIISLVKAKSFSSNIYKETAKYRKYDSANSYVEKNFIGENKNNLDYIIGDIKDIPIKTSKPVNISLVNTIDILERPSDVIKDIFSKLKPSSKILISTPYYWRIDRNSKSQWLDDDIYTHIENFEFIEAHQLVKFESPWVLSFYPRYFQYWNCDVGLWEV